MSHKRPKASQIRKQERAKAIHKGLAQIGSKVPTESAGMPLRRVIRNAMAAQKEHEREKRRKKSKK